ncbi:MAG: hypothetical protein E7426_01070 [Ruminococcaceae bacterium]|nr:hypothetical protein [Oscillospiraceae bacterium]
MATTFKTCLFGGFDREDVIAYIEKTARENKERLDELTRSNETLRRDNEIMSEELASLRDLADKYIPTADALETLQVRAEELTRQVEALTAENEQLRVQAQEYQSLKDHIADIEISAHRRTEEFRASAVAKLHDMMAQQRDWCDGRRQEYSAIQENLQQQLRSAQEALNALDLAGFDRLAQQLQDAERALDE